MKTGAQGPASCVSGGFGKEIAEAALAQLRGRSVLQGAACAREWFRRPGCADDLSLGRYIPRALLTVVILAVVVRSIGVKLPITEAVPLWLGAVRYIPAPLPIVALAGWSFLAPSLRFWCSGSAVSNSLRGGPGPRVDGDLPRGLLSITVRAALAGFAAMVAYAAVDFMAFLVAVALAGPRIPGGVAASMHPAMLGGALALAVGWALVVAAAGHSWSRGGLGDGRPLAMIASIIWGVARSVVLLNFLALATTELGWGLGILVCAGFAVVAAVVNAAILCRRLAGRLRAAAICEERR